MRRRIHPGHVHDHAPGSRSRSAAADGAASTVLDSEFDAESGRGRVTAYPVMRTQSPLTIDIRGLPTPIELDLP